MGLTYEDFIDLSQPIKYVDGDTLTCTLDRGYKDYSTRTFRLKGIDTPETKLTDAQRAANAQLTATAISVSGTQPVKPHPAGQAVATITELWVKGFLLDYTDPYLHTALTIGGTTRPPAVKVSCTGKDKFGRWEVDLNFWSPVTSLKLMAPSICSFLTTKKLAKWWTGQGPKPTWTASELDACVATAQQLIGAINVPFKSSITS
jgi:hypothetical protein